MTNQTSSRQPSPPRPALPTKEEAEARPPLLVMLALCAIVVIASAFAWVLVDNTGLGADMPEDLDEPDDPNAVPFEANAASRIASLSALDPVAAAADRETAQALGEAQAVADASLDAAVAQAMLAVEAALAASSLPALPEGYVPGMQVDVQVAGSGGYALPALPRLATVEALALGAVEGAPSPTGTRSGGLLPLEDLLAQLEEAQATLEGLVGDLPVGGLPVGGLPVGGLPVGGLPVGGPSQVQGAEGAVTPDEEGARLADLHANSTLTATTRVYGDAQASLAGLLAAYSDLAADVEKAIADTRALEEQASADIEATLDERLNAIQSKALGLEASASQVAATHARAVAQAQADAEAALRATLREQVGIVEGTRDNAMASLEDRVRAVQAQADARQAEIVAVIDMAAAELSKPGAPADAVQRFDALQAAAAAAVAKIDRDAKAEIVALEQVAARLHADSQAAVLALQGAAEDARGQINATAAGSLQHALEVKSYLVAVARAEAEVAGEREAELAAATLVRLEATADEHVTGLVRAGMQAADAADSVLVDTVSLVGKVEDLAMGEVGKDLEYIQKVAEDYSKVPTEDRRARAGHWSTAASEIEGVLGATLSTGQALEGLAARTLQAAQQAQAEIDALA